jgi:branched-subunit amino acid ABC-type transport system permease component
VRISDRTVVSFYGFFEEIHGPGDVAEFYALLTWTCLLFVNALSLLVLAISLTGLPLFHQEYGKYVLVAIGIAIALSQFVRYRSGQRLKGISEQLSSESAKQTAVRRLCSIAYVMVTVLAFVTSFWILARRSV